VIQADPLSLKLLYQVIFQVSLAVLDNLQDQLIKCKDDAEAITTLTQYLDGVGNTEVVHEMKEEQNKQVFLYFLLPGTD
jgi:hypothetical protein